MSAVAESDRLLGDGVELHLSNGKEVRAVRLRYSFRGLKRLEDTFGSLDEAMDVLGALGASGAKRIGVIASFLAAGLIHEGFDEDSILDWLDMRSATRDMAAAAEALSQSLPSADEGSGEGTSPNGNGVRLASLGNTSTGSPPSSSGAPIESSGTR